MACVLWPWRGGHSPQLCPSGALGVCLLTHEIPRAQRVLSRNDTRCEHVARIPTTGFHQEGHGLGGNLRPLWFHGRPWQVPSRPCTPSGPQPMGTVPSEPRRGRDLRRAGTVSSSPWYSLQSSTPQGLKKCLVTSSHPIETLSSPGSITMGNRRLRQGPWPQGACT